MVRKRSSTHHRKFNIAPSLKACLVPSRSPMRAVSFRETVPFLRWSPFQLWNSFLGKYRSPNRIDWSTKSGWASVRRISCLEVDISREWSSRDSNRLWKMRIKEGDLWLAVWRRMIRWHLLRNSGRRLSKSKAKAKYRHWLMKPSLNISSRLANT